MKTENVGALQGMVMKYQIPGWLVSTSVQIVIKKSLINIMVSNELVFFFLIKYNLYQIIVHIEIHKNKYFLHRKMILFFSSSTKTTKHNQKSVRCNWQNWIQIGAQCYKSNSCASNLNWCFIRKYERKLDFTLASHSVRNTLASMLLMCLFNLVSAVSHFRRHNHTIIDVRFWCLQSIWKSKIFIIAVEP